MISLHMLSGFTQPTESDMKKLFARLFGALCGVSTEARGAGLGRGTNRGSQLAYWKRLAGFQAVAILLVLAGPVSAGDSRGPTGIGGANPIGGRPSEMSGGGWGPKTWSFQPREVGWNSVPNSHLGTAISNAYRSFTNAWSGFWSGNASVTYDYSSAQNYGIGTGGGGYSGGGMRTEPGIGGY